MKLDEEKSKSKKSRHSTRKRVLEKETFNEDDLVKPNENKLKPLEFDASHLANGHT